MIANRIVLLSEWLHAGKLRWFKTIGFGTILTLALTIATSMWLFGRPIDWLLLAAQGGLLSYGLSLSKRFKPVIPYAQRTFLLTILAGVPCVIALWPEYQLISIAAPVLLVIAATLFVWIFDLATRGIVGGTSMVAGKADTVSTASSPQTVQTNPSNKKAESRKENRNGRRKGRIVWFNRRKGYGFIERKEGDDVFLHQNAVKESDLSRLKKGAPVAYTVESDDRGPRAADVAVVKE